MVVPCFLREVFGLPKEFLRNRVISLQHFLSGLRPVFAGATCLLLGMFVRAYGYDLRDVDLRVHFTVLSNSKQEGSSHSRSQGGRSVITILFGHEKHEQVCLLMVFMRG